MTQRLAVALALAGALSATGCATKRYVRENTEPIKTKVDQVAEQTNKQGQTLDQTAKQVQEQESEISATKEIAKSAEGKADTVGQKTDKNTREIGNLRETLGNLDNYKQAAQVTVLFGFNKDTLTPEAKEELDKLGTQLSAMKRYYVAIEGFTDQTGSASYNLELSRRRADAVVNYLVLKYDTPVYRVQLVGLGKEKLADEGRNREARKKNRRVEVTVYSADSSQMATGSALQGQSERPQD